jgi:hypothetical protein
MMFFKPQRLLIVNELVLMSIQWFVFEMQKVENNVRDRGSIDLPVVR